MIAIVIPYYKKAFFRQTLISLANQTNKNFHVYIGNDASSENPLDLIEEFENDFNLTYKKFDENFGGSSLVRQWERCIDLVQNEEWITILGDDDVYEYNVIDQFYSSLGEIKRISSNVVRFATCVINQHHDLMGELCRHPVKEKATDFLLRKLKGETRSSLSEYFFRTSIVKKIKFKDFPLAWSSDTLAVVEFSQGKLIYTINEATVKFRISNINITGQEKWIEKNEGWFRFYEYLLRNYGKAYSHELVNILFDRIEKVQLNNKKTPLRWIKLFKLYYSYSKYLRFLLIGKKSIRSIQ